MQTMFVTDPGQHNLAGLLGKRWAEGTGSTLPTVVFLMLHMLHFSEKKWELLKVASSLTWQTVMTHAGASNAS